MGNKEFAIFQAENGALQLHSDESKDTVWANLEQIAVLFGRDKSVISRHIKDIFKEEELNKEDVQKFYWRRHTFRPCND